MTDAISAICTTVGHSQLVDHEERRENVGICDDSAFSRETACSSDQVRNATVVNPSEAPIPATGANKISAFEHTRHLICLPRNDPRSRPGRR